MTHADYIRTLRCLVGFNCEGDVVGHHVRTAANAGVGKKPDDRWLVPLCFKHHNDLHQKGVRTFQRRYNLDLLSAAQQIWERSAAVLKAAGIEKGRK